MRARIEHLLVAAWLLAAPGGSVVRSQQPPLPVSPVPVQPPAGQPLSPPILGQPQPVTGPTTPPPVPPALPPMLQPTAPPMTSVPAPILPGAGPPVDPGRDGWADAGLPSRPAGLFLNTEVDILFPSVKNRLSATLVFPNGSTDTLHVPQADLGVTAAPGFEVGYHLADSLGAFLFGYRFLITDGTQSRETSFGEASIKSRLDINQFDLDYVTATYSPLPRYDLQFRFGARMASIFFDSQASNAIDFQQASNYYLAAGPSATVDFERRFQTLPEFGLFLRADGAVLDGQVRQKFRATLGIGSPGEESAFFDVQKTQTSEVLTLQAGFVYHPFGVGNDRLRIIAGYEFQRWWGVGKINGSAAPQNVSSDGEITAQGIFLRGEYDF